MKAHGYARVSTVEQGRSGLGLAAQRDAISTYAATRGWTIAAMHEEIASGGKDGRPVLQSLVTSMGRGDVLIVSRLDRLTRSLLQFAEIVNAATKKGWRLVVVDQGFDMGTPAGRAMAGMLAVFGEYEKALIGQRTSEALRQLPRERRNGQPVYSDETRARARELRADGHTLHGIASILDGEGVKPPRDGAMRASTVSRLLEE